MSGKSQTIGNFTFCRPSQIFRMYRIFARGLSQIPDYEFGGKWKVRQKSKIEQKYNSTFNNLSKLTVLVICEIHRRRPRRYKFEFSFVWNDRRSLQKSGTRREKKNAPDSPDLSPLIPDDRGYLRFRVFISRQNLGRSGNSKIPDRLGFSQHMKTQP